MCTAVVVSKMRKLRILPLGLSNFSNAIIIMIFEAQSHYLLTKYTHGRTRANN